MSRSGHKDDEPSLSRLWTSQHSAFGACRELMIFEKDVNQGDQRWKAGSLFNARSASDPCYPLNLESHKLQILPSLVFATSLDEMERDYPIPPCKRYAESNYVLLLSSVEKNIYR
ncbi:hypothetical protein AVEN_226379-1 [Araneus ventricosus]|uniref:Uncharacterized protein n=1 Tax=Araneus ventricosus TaxID=182803 RepID=A0A4Y2X8H6_ARAVE|nr:hypothetical protein AVEN_226379-1 [Araneus ventricosus]